MPRYAPAVDAQFAEAQAIHEDQNNVGNGDLRVSGAGRSHVCDAPEDRERDGCERMSLVAMPS